MNTIDIINASGEVIGSFQSILPVSEIVDRINTSADLSLHDFSSRFFYISPTENPDARIYSYETYDESSIFVSDVGLFSN